MSEGSPAQRLQNSQDWVESGRPGAHQEGREKRALGSSCCLLRQSFLAMRLLSLSLALSYIRIHIRQIHIAFVLVASPGPGAGDTVQCPRPLRAGSPWGDPTPSTRAVIVKVLLKTGPGNRCVSKHLFEEQSRRPWMGVLVSCLWSSKHPFCPHISLGWGRIGFLGEESERSKSPAPLSNPDTFSARSPVLSHFRLGKLML